MQTFSTYNIVDVSLLSFESVYDCIVVGPMRGRHCIGHGAEDGQKTAAEHSARRHFFSRVGGIFFFQRRFRELIFSFSFEICSCGLMKLQALCSLFILSMAPAALKASVESYAFDSYDGDMTY